MKVKIDSNFLVLTEDDFIELLDCNMDKSTKNEEINNSLIGMIRSRKNNLTDKQRYWIFSKISFIVKTNKRFSTIKGKFDDFRIDTGYGNGNSFIEL
jgi:uncharacterized protein YifE (UPF0438 family)